MSTFTVFNIERIATFERIEDAKDAAIASLSLYEPYATIYSEDGLIYTFRVDDDGTTWETRIDPVNGMNLYESIEVTEF